MQSCGLLAAPNSAPGLLLRPIHDPRAEIGACMPHENPSSWRYLWHSAVASAGGPPSGVVTFLFTDIEGSTRRWEADAAAMRAALAAHDEVLRGDRGARRLLVQPYRRRCGCRVRLSEIGCRRRGRGTTGVAAAGADGHCDRRSRATGRGLL